MLLRLPLLLAGVLFIVTPIYSQYVPGVNNNVTQLSHLDLYSVYSNIWGYTDGTGNEYTLVGVDAGLSIVDITDPGNPVEVDLITGPTAAGTLWREIKTYSHYAYVVSEHTSPNSLAGLQIIDLSPLPDSASLVTTYLWPGVNSTNARAHSVSVDDQGYLYIQGGTSTLGAGGNQGGIRILSLADPENPVPVSVFTPRYVHDSIVRDTLLFACDIFDGGHVDVISVADRANPTLVHSLVYPNGFSHNADLTVDGNHLITTDEVTGLTVKFWDITVLWDTDPFNNDQIDMVAEYIGDTEQIAHNVHMKGIYAYLSHYAEGVKVLDVADPTDPVEVGYFDTYQAPGSGFSGAWGVFPYFPSGTFVVSDIQNGLYVLRFDSVRAGGVEGIVTEATSGNPLEGATATFIEANKTVETQSDGTYELRTNEGMHSIAFSGVGFLPDTVVVQIPSGANTTVNVSLQPNLVEIELSSTQYNLILPIDTVAIEQLIVQNVGIGTLTYVIDDIHGIAFERGLEKPVQRIPGQPGDLRFPDPSGSERTLQAGNLTRVVDTIIVDPAGDLIFGTQPDFLLVLADNDGGNVFFEFQFVDQVNTDSVAIIWSLDTDFDMSTGAHPGGFGFNDPLQGIGAEYDILVDIPGFFGGIPLSVYLWPGANEVPIDPPSFSTDAVVDGNGVSFSIPLSAIGGDDGNLAVAGFGGHLDPMSGTLVSLDFAPNLGFGTIGINPFDDLQWVSLSSKGGVLQTGETDTILVSFDSFGLDSGQVYSGSLLVTSNDPDEPETMIPLTLSTLPVSSVEPDGSVPRIFGLSQNYPNPFNSMTSIGFELPAESHVLVRVYGILGDEIITLVDKPMDAGKHAVRWDARDIPTGIYFYRLQAGATTLVRKMVLLR